MQWLNERENDDSEDTAEDQNLEILKKYISEFVISEKDLLIINLIKTLLALFAKIKGYNSPEFLAFGFKEIKKLGLVENNEIFKLLDRKTKYDRLLTEKFQRYKEILKKNQVFIDNYSKYTNCIENLLFNNNSDNVLDELLGKKFDFYLDVITQNPTSGSLLSKTISFDKTMDEKLLEKAEISEKTKEKSTENKQIDKKSRYQMDFEEIASIGKGSFGEVIKARNKLDGRYYAIKKIKIYQGNFLKRIMREVQTLSLMHHQYVLRYYQAWIEEVETKTEKMVIYKKYEKYVNIA